MKCVMDTGQLFRESERKSIRKAAKKMEASKDPIKKTVGKVLRTKTELDEFRDRIRVY